MTPDQIKLLSGIVISLLLGAGGLFKDEIVNFLFKGRKYKSLQGDWDCTWTEEPNTINPKGKTITDTVNLKRIYGTIVKGTGSNGDLGSWKIDGRISFQVITISYSVTREDKKHQLGVVILTIDPNNLNHLKGKWHQFNGIEIAGGTTEWTKKNKFSK